MFDHVSLRVPDRAALEPAIADMLATLGIARTHRSDTASMFGELIVGDADEQHPVTRGLHIAFVAPTREAVDAFWRAGVAGGLRDNGEPGLRPHYAEGYYSAYVRDAEGNNLEAVHRDGVREDGEVDHVTLRVRDLAAATAFYAIVGAAAGFRVIEESARRALLQAPDGGVLALLPAGPPTGHVHLAFAAGEAGVRAFHDGAVAAGHASNGAPGERTRYGAGYYAAYVIDPDGHNIEVVARPRG